MIDGVKIQDGYWDELQRVALKQEYEEDKWNKAMEVFDAAFARGWLKVRVNQSIAVSNLDSVVKGTGSVSHFEESVFRAVGLWPRQIGGGK